MRSGYRGEGQGIAVRVDGAQGALEAQQPGQDVAIARRQQVRGMVGRGGRDVQGGGLAQAIRWDFRSVH